MPISEAFEKKYGVKLELWRSSSEKVLQRALTEARGGRYAVDAFELNGPEMEALRREGLLEEFYSPQFANLPPAAVPKHRQWVADRFNFFTIAYNTNLVKPAEVPSSYEDLLNPRWVGRIGEFSSEPPATFCRILLFHHRNSPPMNQICSGRSKQQIRLPTIPAFSFLATSNN